MNDKGLLLVISGPSGAGKGTICNALREKFPNIYYSISMTTRQPRTGEVDGTDYYFTTNRHFEELLQEDAFLEHAKVYDHYYGTPKKFVFDHLNKGNHVMLEIDIQGAMQVQQKYPQGVFIYIVPPNKAMLEKRLRGRKTDSDEVIAKRLSKARQELEWIEKYDYVIVNDDVYEATARAEAIVLAEKSSVDRNGYRIQQIQDMYQ